jgi:hypothetical protein
MRRGILINALLYSHVPPEIPFNMARNVMETFLEFRNGALCAMAAVEKQKAKYP